MNCRYIFLIMVLGLTACATPQPPDFTVRNVTPVKNKQQAELRSITVVYDANAKTDIDMKFLARSNVDTASLWKEGLTDALNRTVVFQDDQELKVSLSVRIVEIDATDALGTEMVVTALHELIDRATGEILFKENIKGSGAVPISEAWVGTTRVRLLFEMAVRDNIKNFISTLSEIKLVER